jgi:hypothetical protein
MCSSRLEGSSAAIFEKGLINKVAKRRKKQRPGVEIPLVNLSGFFLDFLRFVLGEVETTSAVLRSLRQLFGAPAT